MKSKKGCSFVKKGKICNNFMKELEQKRRKKKISLKNKEGRKTTSKRA